MCAAELANPSQNGLSNTVNSYFLLKLAYFFVKSAF